MNSSATIARHGRMPVRHDVGEHVLYLVSRFASEANRRLVRVLSLKADRTSSVVVQQDHRHKLQNIENITLSRGLRPGHCFKLLGLRRLGDALDRSLYFPSAAVQFARRAARALASRIAGDLHGGRRVTVVTFVPPHDVLETGRRLKQQFPGIRWVAVCQIVWALDEHHQQSAQPGFVAKMKEFEGSCLRLADRIAVESTGVKEELHRLYQIPRERMDAIENAYDDADIAATTRPAAGSPPGTQLPRQGPFRLGFLGNCFKPPKVPGDRLLAALDSVVARGLPLRLTIVGDAYLDRCPAHVEPYPWVDVRRRCAHSEALTALSDSHALLLFVANTAWARVLMHAKLPYYLASGIPIIAIVPSESNTADIIRHTGTGVVIDSDSDWGDELQRVISEWDGAARVRDRRPEEIARFSWNAIAPKWRRCLDYAGYNEAADD